MGTIIVTAHTHTHTHKPKPVNRSPHYTSRATPLCVKIKMISVDKL